MAAYLCSIQADRVSLAELEALEELIPELGDELGDFLRYVVSRVRMGDNLVLWRE